MTSTQPYSRSKGYHRVVFREKTPLLHTELNEIQLREEDYRKDIIKYSVGSDSYTGNNGFRVMPSSNNDSVLIWPGELFVDGRVMILDKPILHSVSVSTSPITLWAVFREKVITDLDDNDIVFTGKPVTSYRLTYELSIEENLSPFPLNEGEFVFKLAEVNHQNLGVLIDPIDITDRRKEWSENYVIEGIDVTVSSSGNDLLFGSGEIILAGKRELIVPTTALAELGGTFSPLTKYFFYIKQDNPLNNNPSPEFVINTTGYPQDIPIVKLLEVKTDASGKFVGVDFEVRDDRVFAPLPVVRELLSSAGGSSGTITGSGVFNSTDGYVVDFSILDPSGTLYPEFQLGNPLGFTVDISIDTTNLSENQIGQIWVDYSEPGGNPGFTIYNSGSDKWTPFRWSVNLKR